MSLCFNLGDWIRQEGLEDHRPGGRTTWQSNFTADQLVGLFGTYSCSALLSLPISWLDCSVLADQLVRLFVALASSLTMLGLAS
jgi:hypothetical protein